MNTNSLPDLDLDIDGRLTKDGLLSAQIPISLMSPNGTSDAKIDIEKWEKHNPRSAKIKITGQQWLIEDSLALRKAFSAPKQTKPSETASEKKHRHSFPISSHPGRDMPETSL